MDADGTRRNSVDGNGGPEDILAYTVEQAAKRLNIGRTKMWDLVLRGDVESVKIGKSRRVFPEDLEKYRKKLKEQSRTEVAS